MRRLLSPEQRPAASSMLNTSQDAGVVVAALWAVNIGGVAHFLRRNYKDVGVHKKPARRSLPDVECRRNETRRGIGGAASSYPSGERPRRQSGALRNRRTSDGKTLSDVDDGPIKVRQPHPPLDLTLVSNVGVRALTQIAIPASRTAEYRSWGSVSNIIPSRKTPTTVIRIIRNVLIPSRANLICSRS
jgi:hypothetical protein